MKKISGAMNTKSLGRENWRCGSTGSFTSVRTARMTVLLRSLESAVKTTVLLADAESWWMKMSNLG